MTSVQRRDEIAELLKKSKSPLSATLLAKEMNVSRQVIVGDIALLRASGLSVIATPRGYLFEAKEKADEGIIFTIACNHSADAMQTELYTLVDNGAAVLDVIVEHPIYGQLTGQLNIRSRFDVDEFIKNSAASNAPPLSTLTGGVHLHTIQCKDDQTYQRILHELNKEDLLFKNS